ncbi:BgTH12-06396 [Blumeria graminis f. sp. triticale]|uniref:Bgt-2251 n=3 Tax=Blumeria graminis TaxID=34373 RepID=A0A381L1N5_BLUGR|nr:Integral ER membrane protein [Blumeria graminis f. sp. tritici 96224]CAD6500688.1 BgTH12-06396 [Blumeria graminis f. sp. triticale]VCU40967.1 Bgt-2251 [Blumeria graminis f. sp. tritici]
MWLFHVLSSSIFLTSIILSIPIAFDVGGRQCGLAFSLSLFFFYFFYTLLKLATPEKSRLRWALVQLIGAAQWIIIPGLLIWSMNRFPIESTGTSEWVAKTSTDQYTEIRNDLNWTKSGSLLEILVIGSWDKILRYSTSIFQLVEGFCSLLVIQAAGQITRWLVNKGRSDIWMITLLVLSASIMSSSVYFLWRIINFPGISNADAILIGVFITCAVFLGIWGIGSGRGNPVESSLLFAYVVLCMYQIFTDYLPLLVTDTSEANPQADFPPFPPIIMASYSTITYLLSTLPSTVLSGLYLILAAFQTISPFVIISLAYRIFVFYASTRIIPAVRESGARALSQEPSLQDRDGAGKLLGLLISFSPSILVAVYTSLLMQHFSTAPSGNHETGWLTKHDSNSRTIIWRWINLTGTMALYVVELYLGQEDLDDFLTGHWKTD